MAPMMDLVCHDCKFCDRLKEEYVVKFGNLKKKIISTNLLLKKFNEKDAECITSVKRLADSSVLIERLQRDYTKCEVELCRVLQEVEPLKKDNVRLTEEIELARQQLSGVRSQIDADQKSREQLEAKLKLCECREEELRQKKDVAEAKLKATHLDVTKKDELTNKRLTSLSKKYKFAAKHIVNFGQRLQSNDLLSRQLRVILARYERELLDVQQKKSDDEASSSESDASSHQSDCESSAAWRLEQNLIHDEPDAPHCCTQAQAWTSKKAEEAVKRRSSSDVCLSPIWTSGREVAAKTSLVDGSNSPMPVESDHLLDSELLTDLASVFTSVASPISPMPPSPKGFHPNTKYAINDDINTEELNVEENDARLRSNVQLASALTFITPQDDVSLVPGPQESPETYFWPPSSPQPIVLQNAELNSIDISSLELNSDAEIIHLAVVDNSEDIFGSQGDDDDHQSDVVLLSSNDIQEVTEIVSQLDNQIDFPSLISHDHAYGYLNKQSIESPPEAATTSYSNGSPMRLSSSFNSVQQVPEGDLVGGHRAPMTPERTSHEDVAIFYSVGVESPPISRHFRIDALPNHPEPPLVSFFKKGRMSTDDKVLTPVGSMQTSHTSFVKKGVLFAHGPSKSDIQVTKLPPTRSRSVSPEPPVLELEEQSGPRPTKRSHDSSRHRRTKRQSASGPTEFQRPMPVLTSIRHLSELISKPIPVEMQCPIPQVTSNRLSQFAYRPRETSPPDTSPTTSYLPIESSATIHNCADDVHLHVDVPSNATSCSLACQITENKRPKSGKGRSGKLSLRQKVMNNLKHRRGATITFPVPRSVRPTGQQVQQMVVQSAKSTPTSNLSLPVRNNDSPVSDVWKILDEFSLLRPISPILGKVTTNPLPVKEFSFIQPTSLALIKKTSLDADFNVTQQGDAAESNRFAEKKYKRRKRPCESVLETSAVTNSGIGGHEVHNQQQKQRGQVEIQKDDDYRSSPNRTCPEQTFEAGENSTEAQLPVDNIPDGTLSWKLPNFLRMIRPSVDAQIGELQSKPTAADYAVITDGINKLNAVRDDDPNSYEEIADWICSSLSTAFLIVFVRKLVSFMRLASSHWLTEFIAMLRFGSFDFRPSLSLIETKCMKLVLALQTRKDWASIGDTMMETMRQELGACFKQKKLKVNYASLCRLYAAMCRQNCDLARVMILCYDFMFNALSQCGPFIVSVLAICPHLLDGNPTGRFSPCLADVMRFVLVKNRDRIGLPKELNSPDLFSKILRGLVEDDIGILCTKLLANFKRGEPDVSFETVKSFELLSKVQGWAFTNDFLIRKQLWPVLREWSVGQRTDVSDSAIAYNVYLLGCLARQCPADNITTALDVVKAMRALIVKQPSSLIQYQMCIQEAACLAVVMLLPFSPAEGMASLNDWIQLNINVASPEIIQLVTMARLKCSTP